jgi:MinD-like ATPase involved in chromosome partitioning or flagellar assembly
MNDNRQRAPVGKPRTRLTEPYESEGTTREEDAPRPDSPEEPRTHERLREARTETDALRRESSEGTTRSEVDEDRKVPELPRAPGETPPQGGGSRNNVTGTPTDRPRSQRPRTRTAHKAARSPKVRMHPPGKDTVLKAARYGLPLLVLITLALMSLRAFNGVLLVLVLLLLLAAAVSSVVPARSWTYLKAFGRPIGDRTTFGKHRPRQSRKPGLRLWIYLMTGARWNFGPSATERFKMNMNAITDRRDETAITVVTYNEGGGTGKSTSAATVAQQLHISLPGVSILLVDTDPKGTVQDVTGVKREDIQAVKDGKPEEACFTLIDAARNMRNLTDMAQIRWRFATMPGTGLFVLTYPEGERLDRATLGKLTSVLERAFAIVVYDGEPDIDHEDTSFLMEHVDVQVVPALAGDQKRIRQAADAIKTLRDEKYRRGHDRVVFVVDKVWFNVFHRGTTHTVETLQELLGDKPFAGPVATLPWNRLIKKGKVFLVRTRSPWFRRHALELTAVIMETARSTKSASSTEEPAATVNQTPASADITT